MKQFLGGVLLILACGAAATEPLPRSLGSVRVESLTLAPDTVAGDFGDEVRLIATCFNQSDNPVKCRGGVTWTVRDTTKVRPIQTKAESVWAQVRDTGVTYVVARDASGRGTDSTKMVGTSTAPAPITPTPPVTPVLASITLSPDSVTLLPSQLQQYTTVSRSTTGTTMSPTISWAQTGGSINGSGLYTAGSTPGVYRVIASSGGKADTGTVTIEAAPVIPEPGPGVIARMADSVVESFSIQTHLEYTSYVNAWSSIIRPKLLDLGVRHIRQQMTNQSAVWTKFQGLHTDGGITLTGGCWPQGTNYTSAAHCLTQAAGIGASVIDAFDGWNEVDGRGVTNWPAAFTTWQQTQRAAYEGNPTWADKPLFANSLAHASSADQLTDLSAYMDYGNMHSYPGGAGLPGNFTSSWRPQWNKIDGSKPEVATETGYHTCVTCTDGVGVSEAAQAKYLPRLLMEYFKGGVFRANIYELFDEADKSGREAHWGIVKSNGTVKAAYTALKNLLTLLDDPGVAFSPTALDYTLTGALASTHSQLLQKRDGTFWLVLWQEVSSYNTTTETNTSPAADAVTLTFSTSQTAIAVYKPSVGTSAIQTGSGTSISLSVPDELLIVKVTP